MDILRAMREVPGKGRFGPLSIQLGESVCKSLWPIFPLFFVKMESPRPEGWFGFQPRKGLGPARPSEI